MAFSFLNLPAEIRDQIYHEVLSATNARRPPLKDDDPGTFEFDLGVLRVNKQIHHEAKKAFEDNVFIKITTPWSESIDHISSEGRVPIITKGKPADDFHAFHLWVWIVAPGVPDRGVAYSMVISLDDLPAFTRMWHFSNLNHQGLNPHLGLKLTLQDPHVPDRKIPRNLQTLLLQPFALVKDLHSFTVEGAKVLPSVEEALKTEQAIPDASPEESLARATALKTLGNQSLQAGEYAAALQQYTDAFAAIHITVSGRKRYIHADGYYRRELTSGPYQGQRSDYARIILRVQLVANVLQVYLKMQGWEDARFWGKRSILLFRKSLIGETDDELGGSRADWAWVQESATMGFPARTEMGKILYRTALASYELKRQDEVANLMWAAAVYLPHDQIVQARARAWDTSDSESID
ncbi:MAG: hypothetical protein LQ350_004959 [Teloschistes chrysophthalmus]|nr:MAG: hypothetical protein LQ350_004959 [Niorma chrysophthalma]